MKVEASRTYQDCQKRVSFAAFAECEDPRAKESWAEHSWKSPVSGQLNSIGTWAALERSVIGLARMGRKAELATLRP